MSGGRSENTLVLALQLVQLWLVCIPSIFGNSAHGAQAGRKLSTEIPGFISIDCGVDNDYYDENNGIYYKSDMKFIDTGKNMPVEESNSQNINSRMTNLRSFPEGVKNCYTLKPENGKGEMYLIRAHFVYGNYDGKNQPPTFDLYLGVNKWVTVSTKTENYTEIIHYSLTDKIDVCLINTGSGIPFISVLLLRHLNNSIYKIESGALATIWRYDVGGSTIDIRYKDDVYDRLWNPPEGLNWFPISTQSTIDTQSSNYTYFPPEVVLKTAARSQDDSESLDYVWTPDDKTSEYYIIFHFAEIELLEDGQQRELNISLSDEYPLLEPIKLEYLKPLTIGTLNWKVKDEKLAFSIYPTKESKLSPILNAVELFKQILLPNSPTAQQDAKKKRKFVVPVVASIVSLLIVFLLTALFLIFWNRKRTIQGQEASNAPKGCRELDPGSSYTIGISSGQEASNVPKGCWELDPGSSYTIGTSSGFAREGSLKSMNQQFTYSQIVRITNNFERVIGEGGFGKVYLGTLKDKQVAVKFHSTSSEKGDKEFHTEVELLMRIHHRNLVSLIGYCSEGKHMALVYEYVPRGNLRHHLSETNTDVLDWQRRLQIAIDAAQGLDYLHKGCKPPILHRDIKTSNILLDEKNQAKIADFGLSRDVKGEHDTHVLTGPAGTLAYIDPEYMRTGQYRRESDVYSFGIVLLELISGQRAVIGGPDLINIIEWVSPFIQRGDINAIVDQRLHGQFSIDSAKKAVDIAMPCVHSAAIQRPDISSVLAELKECLAIEVTSNASIYFTA